ncbi:hypothetical protein Godav_029658 [Gossypium davidsonii]|uniref:Uncharacterized protein n=2 Tax=Gossypium davidsonii TaxID=34287 RepID=A0A7J8TJ53_GOSDV|nr:hypothetical protein [Gossypium davidsonii]
MAGCFFGEMSYVKSPASGVVKGIFVPKLNGQGATSDAIALLGALDACRYFLIESAIALFVAFLINVVVVVVSASVCTADNVSSANQ